MITTTLLTLLAAAEVSSSSPEANAPDPRTWGVQLSLAAPSLLGASFELGGLSSLNSGVGVLGAVSRPSFNNAITVERAFGEKTSGVAALSFGFSVLAPITTTTGAGMIGVRWYAKRTFDGFWAGPELLFQTNITESAMFGVLNTRSYGAGARGRAGWTQPFGEHFTVTASAGLGANLSWQTLPLEHFTLNLGLDVSLGAGLVF